MPKELPPFLKLYRQGGLYVEELAMSMMRVWAEDATTSLDRNAKLLTADELKSTLGWYDDFFSKNDYMPHPWVYLNHLSEEELKQVNQEKKLERRPRYKLLHEVLKQELLQRDCTGSE